MTTHVVLAVEPRQVGAKARSSHAKIFSCGETIRREKAKKRYASSPLQQAGRSVRRAAPLPTPPSTDAPLAAVSLLVASKPRSEPRRRDQSDVEGEHNDDREVVPDPSEQVGWHGACHVSLSAPVGPTNPPRSLPSTLLSQGTPPQSLGLWSM